MSTAEERLLRAHVEVYGQSQYNKKQQIIILLGLLKKASRKIREEEEIAILASCIQQLEQILTEFNQRDAKRQLEEAIKRCNTMVAKLEQTNANGELLNELSSLGLYRILYHYPHRKGRQNEDDILRELMNTGFIGVGISALITALFAAAIIFSAPYWLVAITTGLFTGATAYIGGLLYGVVNDLYATRMNLPYFLLGHQPQQLSVLRSNDPNVQGIAWGVAATFGPVFIASIIFTIVATITAFFVPMATFILPLLLIAMPLIAVGAEFYAQRQAKSLLDTYPYALDVGSNSYQINNLDYMCPTREERAAWHANSDRNLFGFTKVPLIGGIALIAYVALSASHAIPAVLLTGSLFSFAIPVIGIAIGILALTACGIYMYYNRDKQVDNRYKLNFEPGADLEPRLYLDEDMELAHELISEYEDESEAEIITPMQQTSPTATPTNTPSDTDSLVPDWDAPTCIIT